MRIPKRISPGLLVASVAIVAALAGTAMAGSTVTAAKHSDKAADKRLFRNLLAQAAPNLNVRHARRADRATNADQANTAGSTPEADHATNADKLGDVAAASYLRDREVVTKTSVSDSSSPKTANAVCPEGKVQVGGGATLTVPSGGEDNVALAQSGPGNVFVAHGFPPTFTSRPGWLARAYETSSLSGAWSIKTTVICVTG